MKRDEFKRTLSDIAAKAQAEFDELINKLQTMESEAAGARDEVSTKKTEVDNLKQTTEDQASKIADHLSKGQANQQEFDELMAKARDKDEGVEAALSSLKTDKEQADSLASDINAIKEDLLLKQKDATDKSKVIGEKHNNILEIDQESSRIKEDIEKTYKLAVHAGLAGATTTRKRELDKTVNIWLGIFGGLLLAIAAVIIETLITLQDKKLSDILLSRAVLITPLVALAALSFAQFRNERKLLEEYAFKAAVAQSLESFTNVLNREFPNGKYKDRILKFVTKAMGDIYDRTVLEKQPLTFSFGVKSKLAEIEAKISEIDNKLEKTVAETKDAVTEIVEETEASTP